VKHADCQAVAFQKSHYHPTSASITTKPEQNRVNTDTPGKRKDCLLCYRHSNSILHHNWNFQTIMPP